MVIITPLMALMALSPTHLLPVMALEGMPILMKMKRSRSAQTRVSLFTFMNCGVQIITL